MCDRHTALTCGATEAPRAHDRIMYVRHPVSPAPQQSLGLHFHFHGDNGCPLPQQPCHHTCLCPGPRHIPHVPHHTPRVPVTCPGSPVTRPGSPSHAPRPPSHAPGPRHTPRVPRHKLYVHPGPLPACCKRHLAAPSLSLAPQPQCSCRALGIRLSHAPWACAPQPFWWRQACRPSSPVFTCPLGRAEELERRAARPWRPPGVRGGEMRARHQPLSPEAGTSAGSDGCQITGRPCGAVDKNKRTNATLGSTAVSVWCFPRHALRCLGFGQSVLFLVLGGRGPRPLRRHPRGSLRDVLRRRVLWSAPCPAHLVARG